LRQDILPGKHQRAETGGNQCTLAVKQDARHDDGQRIKKRKVAINAACEIDDGGRKAKVAKNLKVSLPNIVNSDAAA
jgi:hypothetical protein